MRGYSGPGVRVRGGPGCETAAEVQAHRQSGNDARRSAVRKQRVHGRGIIQVTDVACASVLAHPQILSVTVRVEKLEVSPGSVGVEITREKLAKI